MNQKGFTLIELLVVVLIIGILSAVALPQYSKAVDKARGTEALTMGKALADAENLYFMQNRAYTSYMDDLSIEIENGKNFSVSPIEASGISCVITIAENDGEVSLKYYLSRGKVTKTECVDGEADAEEGSACKRYFNVENGGSL